MSHYLFSSEAVAIGHPDKVADQLSDSILDACLAQDPNSRVACEAVVTAGLVFLTGEITTRAKINFEEIVRQTIKEIGYTDPSLGFDDKTCKIITAIHQQSPDIARGVDTDEAANKEQGAGDQGLVFGFACDDTPELMPLPHMFSQQIIEELRRQRVSGAMPFLRPDGKSQVTVEYNERHEPVRIHTVVVSTQHSEEISHDELCKQIKALIIRIAPKGLIDDRTVFYINSTGRFVMGGPAADSGLTGRKPIVDTYGAMGRHGGGAFSGKDPSKVDRSGAYAARYVAKNIVAAKLARRCEVQISYAIGIPFPIAIKVDTFGTSTVSEEVLAKAIPQVFDLSPAGIINMLQLKRPIYRKTAYGGHFGREDDAFTWEKTDKIDSLQKAVKKLS
jgi:S-adenosylmethionine synthetase